MYVTTLNSDNFNEIISGSKPVVVDFWAAWCGPCKMFAPNFHQVAEEMHEEAVFGKVNVDEAEDIARKYKIMSIPTIMIFKDGQPVAKTMGLMSPAQLTEMVKEAL